MRIRKIKNSIGKEFPEPDFISEYKSFTLTISSLQYFSKVFFKSANKMSYKELLISIYDEAKQDNCYREKLSEKILNNINIIAEKCFIQKGVYTVLITLSIYKILHPEQDIRNHQMQIKNGFSGRTIDTQHITPTLKQIGLPSMAESGWLTRSLEQPYPFTLDYQGKIGNKEVKKAFLELINTIEVEKVNPKYILVELFKQKNIISG